MQPNQQKMSIRDALEYAKQSPDSEFAKILRKSIESGQLDEAAVKQGIDLTKYGRTGTKPANPMDVLFGIPAMDQIPEAGTQSTQTSTPQTSNEPGMTDAVVKTLGLEGATEVFGSLLARQGVNTNTPKEITQKFVEKPTAGQVAGAALQTAAVPAGFALTGGSSAIGQATIGGLLGYAYDVGSDLVERKSATEVVTPGVGTVIGVTAPLAIAGAGSLFNKAYGIPAGEIASQVLPESGVTQAIKETPVPNAITQTAEDIVIAGGRVIQRGQDFAQSQAEKAARIAAAPAPVKQAIRANIDSVIIDLAQNADEQTKVIMREMVERAETPKTGRVTPNPTAKAGDVAVKQYEAVTKARQNIGKQIGKLSDSLPAAKNIDNTPSIQKLNQTLQANDIVLDPVGKLQFGNLSFTQQQQSAIQELYDVATANQSLSARQIHQLDQRFSAMQRQKQLVDKVGNIYLDTPEGKQNVFALFRNTYRTQLDDIAPDFRELNKQYAQYTNLVENIEGSLIRSKDFGDLIAPDGSVYAEAGLRRMFGEGVGAQVNADLYNALDTVSRANGYTGARADELYYFGNKLRDIYPETVPETGIRKNISTSIRDVVGDVLDVGKVRPQDKQKALKKLLGFN